MNDIQEALAEERQRRAGTVSALKEYRLPAALKLLTQFIPKDELHVLKYNLKGEEGSYFCDLLVALADRITAMPKVYEQDGKGDEAIAYLHYFTGGSDWWITEKDSEPEQLQAFGFVQLNGDAELGYISIVELLENNIELDINWTPKTLREIKHKLTH